MSGAQRDDAIPNGPAAAAILAAGIGCFFVGFFATLADAFPGVSSALSFYTPTGALSGVTTTAIVVWLVTWFILDRRWANRRVAIVKVNVVAFVMLALGVLLTFPPFMDLIQGK
jgi:fluoride ion exporter CrcB/FEX